MCSETDCERSAKERPISDQCKKEKNVINGMLPKQQHAVEG